MVSTSVGKIFMQEVAKRHVAIARRTLMNARMMKTVLILRAATGSVTIQEFKTAGRLVTDAVINAWNIWPSAHTSPPMIIKILCLEPSVKSLVMLINATDVRRQFQIVKRSLKSYSKIADAGLTVLSLVNLPIALGKPSL